MVGPFYQQTNWGLLFNENQRKPNSYPNRPWLYENRKYTTVAIFHLSVSASPGGGRACASSSSGSTSKAHNIDLCFTNGRKMLQFSPYHKEAFINICIYIYNIDIKEIE